MIYLSHPLTTGSRSFEENRASAARLAGLIQKHVGTESFVFNPCATTVPGWSHDDYMRLYGEMFRSGAVKRVAFCPGWRESVGCRMEWIAAMVAKIPMFEVGEVEGYFICKEIQP